MILNMHKSARTTKQKPAAKIPRGMLTLGGLGAVLASSCCILPFVLVTAGLGGAWLANLHALFPYRWWFIGGASIALIFAWRRLYRNQRECAVDEVCAVPSVQRGYRIAFWCVIAMLLLAAIAPYLLSTVLL